MADKAIAKNGLSADHATAYEFLMLITGLLAFSIPIMVVLLDLDDSFRSSISAYYYGSGRTYFVASIGGLSVFLLSYQYPSRPNWIWDRRLAIVGSIAAAAVALFPTAPSENASDRQELFGVVHLSGAAVLFICLGLFAGFHFTKTGEASDPQNAREAFRHFFVESASDDGSNSGKLLRNRIYRTMGWLIFACIALIIVDVIADLGLFFWLEVIAVEAFAIAWLVKSQRLPFVKDWLGD